jgi:hypothetical protein
MCKPLRHENIQIGKVLSHKEFLITDALIRTCAQVIESIHPWDFEDALLGGLLAHQRFSITIPAAWTVTASSIHSRVDSLRPQTAHATIDRR